MSYPQLKSLNVSHITINATLEALSKKYQCEGRGYKTFSAKIEFRSKRMMSISYEDMWMCANMPRPDSTSGVLMFNMESGEIMTVEQLFLSDNNAE